MGKIGGVSRSRSPILDSSDRALPILEVAGSGICSILFSVTIVGNLSCLTLYKGAGFGRLLKSGRDLVEARALPANELFCNEAALQKHGSGDVFTRWERCSKKCTPLGCLSKISSTGVLQPPMIAHVVYVILIFLTNMEERTRGESTEKRFRLERMD